MTRILPITVRLHGDFMVRPRDCSRAADMIQTMYNALVDARAVIVDHASAGPHVISHEEARMILETVRGAMAVAEEGDTTE